MVSTEECHFITRSIFRHGLSRIEVCRNTDKWLDYYPNNKVLYIRQILIEPFVRHFLSNKHKFIDETYVKSSDEKFQKQLNSYYTDLNFFLNKSELDQFDLESLLSLFHNIVSVIKKMDMSRYNKISHRKFIPKEQYLQQKQYRRG